MTKGPFIKSRNSSYKMMINVFISLIPIIIFGFYKNGIIPYIKGKINFFHMLYPLIFVFLGGFFTYFIERMYAKYFLKKKEDELNLYMRYSFSVLPGIFLALILPIKTPILVLLFGSFMAIVFGKMVYGGFGKNIFNPALTGALFIFILYFIIGIDLNNVFPLGNSYVSLLDLFNGFITGAMSETVNLLSLFAFVYLSFKKVIKRKIPMIYVGTVFLMCWIIGRINHLDISYPLYQILSGGLLFSAVFMATDPVTSPTTPIGQVIYATCLGILTIVFRYILVSPFDILISILIMNLLVKVLDDFGSRFRGMFSRYSLFFIIVVMVALAIALFIGNSYKI